MNNQITVHPGILGGKPIIVGTRISVEEILGLLANGMTQKEIIKSYPSLTEASVKAALEFAQSAVQKEFPAEATKQMESEQMQTIKNPMARRIIEAVEKSYDVTMEDVEALLQVIKENQIPVRFKSLSNHRLTDNYQK
jgi:uncharacterized protein (DUF433 family)